MSSILLNNILNSILFNNKKGLLLLYYYSSNIKTTNFSALKGKYLYALKFNLFKVVPYIKKKIELKRKRNKEK